MGGTAKQQSDAYKSGGRRFQDEYHKAVSIYSGLARIGPKRRRIARDEWQAEKQKNDSIAFSIALANERIKSGTNLEKEVELKLKDLEKRQTDLIQQKYAFVQYKESEIRRVNSVQAQISRNIDYLSAVKSEINILAEEVNIKSLTLQNIQLREKVTMLSGLLTATIEPSSNSQLPQQAESHQSRMRP